MVLLHANNTSEKYTYRKKRQGSDDSTCQGGGSGEVEGEEGLREVSVILFILPELHLQTGCNKTSL